MERDPGILAHPWVTVEQRGRAVVVDGVPFDGPGPVAARTQQALGRVSRETAARLGRVVGATVVAPDGLVTHYAVRPDGSAVEIETLVHEAHAPLLPVIPLRRGQVAGGKRRGPWSRRLAWSLAGALAVGLGAGGVAALASASDKAPPADTRPVALTTPTPTPSSAASPASSAPLGQSAAALVADVAPAGPGRVLVSVGAIGSGDRVTVTLRPATGATVVRQLVVRRGVRSLVVAGLPGGTTAWSVAAAGVRLASGTVQVVDPPAPPAPSSLPSPSMPSTTPPAGGSGGGGGGGKPEASPSPVDVTPIDPDDG